MNYCTWRERKVDEDWCRWGGIRTRRQDSLLPATWPSRLVGALMLHGEDECHLWLNENLHGRKTSSIMTMREQMVETRSWKAARALLQDGHCRVCHERDETIEHLVAGCKVLANSEYLSRHNRALMVMSVAWAKEYKLVGGDAICTKKGGNEERCQKMKGGNSCGVLNSIYVKPQQREDLTWPFRTKRRKKYGFATWHALNNGTLRLKP